ncbi:disease resistance RPP13-like protein 4 [Juglans microcarpa x Juglans regia]|uniref:disease resistance RPP13-like protein 4 n=1 Tax=Juglans microcarpa x Juglans regia TaxID=2249226 RepID=UPI001B7E0E16|nr:disease resistance RPP13-like protein 4 [Juglans microcarpa x Juglans regia]
MASSDGTQKISAEKFNIQRIIGDIDSLLERLPTVEHSATGLTPNNTDRNNVSDGNPNNGNKGGNIPSINGGYSNQKNEIDENKNGHNVSDQDPCASIWTLLTFGCSADNKENNSDAKDSFNSSRSSNDSSNQSQLERITKTLTQVKAALIELKKLEEGELGKRIQPHLRRVDTILGPQAPAPADSSSLTLTEAKLREISKEIMKIKNQIPSLLKLSLTGPGSYNNSGTIKNSDACSAFQGNLNPHKSKSFLESSFYHEIKEIYDDLNHGNDREKVIFFLSCFAMLPENAVVKRRLLTYWWVGEGLIDEGKTAENHVDQILKRFREKGLIKPAKKELRGEAKSYRMHPLVRSAVIKLSKNKFFAFNDNGILTGNLSDSGQKRACVTKSSVPLDTGLTREQKEEDKKFDEEWKNLNQEELITIFNVNEPFPDLKLQLLAKKKELSVVEWLSKMKNVKVLYLGRWQKSATYHIEVESIEFLKGLKSMKELRLLSLQGISRINELPSSIGKLSKLMILDVKSCHNLEELPQEISRLKELKYLDVSDCYMLDRMPKGLSSLSKLQVLKGYVIGNPQSGSFGTLDDLKDLKHLRKLTISASSREVPPSKTPEFPTRKDLFALNRLGTNGALRKLTLAWGSKQGTVAQKTTVPSYKKPPSMLRRKLSKKSSYESPEAQLPEKLEKLDLQCYPGTEIPSWLVPSNMKSLKKLFIRGGGLETLKNEKWTVETLCLKYLIGLKLDWIELQQRFPNLAYLEKVGCPRITFCPCDEDGVWKKPTSN